MLDEVRISTLTFPPPPEELQDLQAESLHHIDSLRSCGVACFRRSTSGRIVFDPRDDCLAAVKPVRIGDLTADQLALHAENVFLFQQRHTTGARLIYHSLALDSKNGVALKALSDFLDSKGTEQLSGAVMELALGGTCELTRELKFTLERFRLVFIWTYKFAVHSSGRAHLAWEDFKDPSKFDIDWNGYQAFIAPIVKMGGSLEGAVAAARVLTGSMGKLLVHQSQGANPELHEIFHVERFVATEEYSRWLSESTEELDELERARISRGLLRSIDPPLEGW